MKLSGSAVRLAVGIGLGLVGSLAVAAAQDVQDAKTQLRDRALATKQCAGCDLSGAGFAKGADLKGADLSGAKLTGAGLYGVDLTDSNLHGADLSKAVLAFADLSNANLGDANLDGANLTGAKNANLAGAITTEATSCPDGQSGPCR